jgi:tetratricopeptide (TPR) repeat protein
MFASFAIVGGGIATVVGFLIWRPADLDCKAASSTASDAIAVAVCKTEFERTNVPLTGAYYADALRRSGDLTTAEAVASSLLGTPIRGDAQQILGKIATSRGRTDDAFTHLQDARRLHREQGNHVELARDGLALVRIYEDKEQYGDALLVLEEAISEARVAGDARTEGYCHLGAARVLSTVGYFEPAHEELDRAGQQLSGARDLAQLWRARGDLEQEVGRGPVRVERNKEAVIAFERSLGFAAQAQLASILPTTHLNLAYSLAEVGRTEDADRHLAEAGVLDSKGAYERPRQELAARIAYRRKDYSLASSLNERVYPQVKTDDERMEISVMQARIALDRSDLAAATLWARRGVEHAEQVRAAQTLSELRPWVLASRREPFELLFTAYARDGKIEDAIAVFDLWQGRTLLDKLARPSSDPSPTLSTTATRVQSLGRWLPVVSKAPLMSHDEKAVLATLRTIDLLALVVADGEVWRLTAARGRFKLDDLGPLDKLHDLLERFTSAPTDAALATELGELVLPGELARRTDDTLYVVLDTPFADLPFVALRRDGQVVVALRPVLRAPRLPVVTSCKAPGLGQHSPAGERRALVLADATGDLPDARLESGRVAAHFGTTPLVGAAATSTALFAAKSDPLLHVAVHAEVDAGGGVLKLHDREVSAAEISANRLGPRLVVLSGCSTARSEDPELAGSLSTAFLAGGSQQVVATLRPVSDAGALEVTSRFYSERGADGPEGPVRVLARIQADLSKGDNKEWPNFAVFGVCTPPS